MPEKTYVLLDHTKPSVPIYIQADANNRIKLDARPVDHAYLQLTAYNAKSGINKTLRLKLNSNTIFQDEQIEKEKIPANEKFTNNERNAVKFTYGVNRVKNEIVQRFLETSPQFEGSEWVADEIQPLYRLLDKEKDIDAENSLFMLQLQAGNKIASLNLEQGQNLMIRLNGSFFTPPETLKEVQNALVLFMNATDEEGLNQILREDTTIDEDTTIIIGRLVAGGVLSFDAVKNQVAKKKGKEWVNLKEISSDLNAEERKRYFSQFVTSDAGKLLLEDLKKESEKLLEKIKK